MSLEEFYASAHWGWALVGLASLWLLGDGVYRLLRATHRFGGADAVERTGMRILLGPASVAIVCIGFDLLGVPINRFTLVGAALVVQLGARGLERRGPGVDPGSDPADTVHTADTAHTAHTAHTATLSPAVSPMMRKAGVLAYLLGAACVGQIILSGIQVTVFPPRVYDALVGWDVVGKIMAFEGAYRSSVFEKLHFNAQAVYPPFCASNQGFWYIFFPTAPQAWVTVIMLGFALAFWSRVSHWTQSATAASLAVFLAFTPPELAFHTTVGQTDLPSMIFTVLMFLATIEAGKGSGGVFAVAVWSLAASIVRPEAVLFALASSLFLLVRRVPWRRAVWPFVISAAMFAFWNLLIVPVRLGYDAGQHFRRTLDWDPQRAAEVFRNAQVIIWQSGELAWLIPAIPLLWLLGRTIRWSTDSKRNRMLESRGMQLAGLLLLAFLLYMPYFYMWDPVLNPLWTMAHTFKRGYFRFIPALILVALCTRPMLALIRSCDGRASGDAA